MGYILDLRKLVGSRPIITTGASVLLCENGCLLLQRRTDNGLWALPGGSMEPGAKNNSFFQFWAVKYKKAVV